MFTDQPVEQKGGTLVKAQAELKWLNRAPAAFGGVTWGVPWAKGVLQKGETVAIASETPRICKHGRSRIGLTARLNGRAMPQYSQKKAAADLHCKKGNQAHRKPACMSASRKMKSR